MFKVAILQKRAINAQIDKNIETIIMAMEEASENHADILLLPECFITGYDLPMSYEKSISELESKYADDRVAYTNGKQNMINKILGKWKRRNYEKDNYIKR